MLNAYSHAYTGADVAWPRLVTLFEGNGLAASTPFPQWNGTEVAQIADMLPTNGMLITRIDRPFSALTELQGLSAWSDHPRVGAVVVHGAYNAATHFFGTKDVDPSAEATKTHELYRRPFGATVHILSEDFFLSLSPEYIRHGCLTQCAYNLALKVLAGLQLSCRVMHHEEQFKKGVTAPFYDLVCAKRENDLLVRTAYLANYATPRR